MQPLQKTIKIVLTALTCVSLLSACEIDGTSQTNEDGIDPIKQPIVGLTADKITLNDRYYLLAKPHENFLPAKSYKLLLAFHPSGGNAAGMQRMAKFEALSEDYIVVYPQAKVEEWEEGCQCNKPHRLGIDDLTYVDEVIANVKDSYNILPDEIYAAGFSQGALFTQNLLCNRSDVFNAIVSVGAPMSVQLSESCAVAVATDYLMVHGTADSVLPYKGKNHANFGLIGSEHAIDLIADLNQISVPKTTETINEYVQYHNYQDEQTINRLVEVKNGRHTWSHNHYDTSTEVLKFFEQASNSELPEHSQLFNINAQSYHVRTMGDNEQSPAIVLLSGPNYNFHSDSAWFALLQPMLANQFKVHAIDRLGNGFSAFNEQASYQHFGNDLPALLSALGIKDVLIVGFSSSNIASKLLIDNENLSQDIQIKGLVWVDPDILISSAIDFYQDYPVSWYRENLDQLLPYLASGAWTERTAAKLAIEKEEITQLVSEQHQSLVDWQYFNVISQRRLSIPHQQTRAIEIALYHDDLELARGFTYNNDIPISIIDSDFERKDIANAEGEDKEILQHWMTQGTEWSKLISADTGGIYRPIENADHMVTFEHPSVIIEVITQTLALDK